MQLYRHEASEEDQEKQSFFNLKSQRFFFLYSFASFTLELTTTLLQLATFYIWNVKPKDDGMDQNTLHYCYGVKLAN